MDYNVHNEILLGDAHSKHILIILVIHSWNFIKLEEWFSEFEWNDNRTQKIKSNRLLIKRWDFSRMNILNAKNFISWAEGITNAALSNQTHVCCVCRHIAKLCSYILYKNNSLKKWYMKGAHSNKFLNCLLVGCKKFHRSIPPGIWKVISPTWENVSTEEFWHKCQRFSS